MTDSKEHTWQDWAGNVADKLGEPSGLSRQEGRTAPATTREQAIADRTSQMPKASIATYRKATRGKASPRVAIKAFCMECVGWNRAEVTECTALACPLWMYRPFQREGRNNG